MALQDSIAAVKKELLQLEELQGIDPSNPNRQIQIPVSQSDLLMLCFLRLVAASSGTGGGGGGNTIDSDALATAIADKISLKTLTVNGDSVNESALASAIASALVAITQTVSLTSLPPLAAGSNTIGSVSVSSLPAATLDTDGSVKISKSLAPSTCLSGDRVIATANTPENLSSSTPLKNGVFVQADGNNTGLLYVWATASNGGPAFKKDDGYFFQIDDPSKLKVSVSVAGDRVRWWAS
jgi:hypothetical protein